MKRFIQPSQVGAIISSAESTYRLTDWRRFRPRGTGGIDMRRWFGSLPIVPFVGAVVLAGPQVPAPPPSFETVSIKRSTATDGRTSNRIEPGGRYTAVNVPVLLLIR